MSTMLKQCAVSVMTISLLLLAGCSQSSKPAAGNESQNEPQAVTKPAGPPQLVSAKTAFWPMYASARKWATDIVPLRLTEEDVPGFTHEAGKAAMWNATFASPSSRQYRVYSYSIAAVPPDIEKGVSGGPGQPWGGETRDAMSVDLSLFNIDSDTAYKSAADDAVAWLKKHPDEKVSSFELGNTFKFQGPVWYIQWGTKKSGYVAIVNATTGQVLKGK